jgi:TPR repeat protein
LVALGEIAHIVADSPNGPRGDSPLTAAARNDYQNLILLCNQHHQLIDSQPNSWTVARLQEMKSDHELWVEERLGGTDNVTNTPFEETNSRSLVELVEVIGGRDGELPRVADLDPYTLGATPSRWGNADSYGVRDRYVRRTTNNADHEITDALAGQKMVLVVGPSKAGKTRTAFEAVLRSLPLAQLLAPLPGALADLIKYPSVVDSTDDLVVWLDDLNRFLSHPRPLTVSVLRRLQARSGRTAVIATLRRTERKRLRGDSGELSRDVRQLLRQAVSVDLEHTDLDERREASSYYPQEDLRHHGLGEVLAGALDLLEHYDDARQTSVALYAAIAIVIDWARVGRPDPIPEPLLREHIRDVAAELRPHLDISEHDVDDAIIAARTAPGGYDRASAIRAEITDGTRGYRPFDYLLAADDGEGRSPRPIPEELWQIACEAATPEVLLAVGGSAYFRGKTRTAIDIYVRASQLGEVTASNNLGAIAERLNDPVKAEKWYLYAADEGSELAMFNLGSMYERQHRLDEAMFWYSRAGQRWVFAALARMAVISDHLGDGHAAELFRGAASGNLASVNNLGVLYIERGDAASAEQWYATAAEVGYATAMCNLASCLYRRNEKHTAEQWYRRAADLGDSYAMVGLAACLHERGESTDAENLLRRAARVGNVGAIFSLGRLLDHLGRSDEALAWYMQASPQHPQAAQAFKTRWFAALNPRSLPHEIGIPHPLSTARVSIGSDSRVRPIGSRSGDSPRPDPPNRATP